METTDLVLCYFDYADSGPVRRTLVADKSSELTVGNHGQDEQLADDIQIGSQILAACIHLDIW